MIGKEIGKVLNDIEETIWRWEAAKKGKFDFPDEAIRSACKIFATVLIDKMVDLQMYEDMDMEDRLAMAKKCGEDIRHLVKVYSDKDTIEMFDDED